MSRRCGRGPERGISLVELLIATTLGLVVIGGMYAVLAGNRRSAELAAAFADLQENGRYALSLIAADARMSGYQGCMDPNNGAINILADDAPSDDLRSSATSGSLIVADDDWRPLPTGFTIPAARPAVAGGHALTLQYGSTPTTRPSGQMSNGGGPSTSAALEVEEDIGLAAGDLAIVANCEVGDLFAVTGVAGEGKQIAHTASRNSSGALTRAYGDARTRAQTELMRFVSNTWFVAETDLVNDRGEPIRALYRQGLPYGDSSNPPIEIVRHVETLRVAFGQRAADGSLSYVVPGDAAFDPTRVELVRLGLLMVSEQHVTDVPDTATYLVAGQPVAVTPEDSAGHARDRRLRIAFNTVVKVRNRRDD